MTAIIHQKDKRSGLTYAYQSESWWDKEKKQSRSKRTLIGRVNPQTGAIEETDGRGRRSETEKKSKRGPVPAEGVKRSFYGATYLFDSIGDRLGITSDLKQCFPATYRQILSLAYYMILEDSSPLFRFEKWSTLHKHPYGKNIPSQRGSELFASISDEAREQFFRLQGRRRAEKEFWAYDSTSISSYSGQLSQVAYGNNKENDHLAQLNLLMLFGEASNLPFYYRKLAGNIPDVKTVKHLVADLDVFGWSKVKVVMDRGFYSEANINGLFGAHIKFLMSVKTSLAFVRKHLDTVYDTIRHFDNFSEKYELYARAVRTDWEYRQDRPYKGDTLTDSRRLYVHVYYNIDRAADDEKAFDRQLIQWRRELESGRPHPEHERQYAKYFHVKTTPRRGITVSVNEKAITKARRYYGFFVLITNETMDGMTALELYRNKDVVEKAFGNLKERLNLRRTLVSSEQSLEGKLFVAFVALIYLSYIKKQMQTSGLFSRYTVQTALDQLDVIECFEHQGKALRIGEILEKQKQLYMDLGIDPPSSL
jgi:transposase